jgi:hypothetical protein
LWRNFFRGRREIAALFKWGVPGFFSFSKKYAKIWGVGHQKATRHVFAEQEFFSRCHEMSQLERIF